MPSLIRTERKRLSWTFALSALTSSLYIFDADLLSTARRSPLHESLSQLIGFRLTGMLTLPMLIGNEIPEIISLIASAVRLISIPPRVELFLRNARS